jgi:hypothetical protein
MKNALLTWLVDRFTEPSSHAGIAMVVASVFGLQAATTQDAKIGAIVGIIFGGLAILVPEKATALLRAAKDPIVTPDSGGGPGGGHSPH